MFSFKNLTFDMCECVLLKKCHDKLSPDLVVFAKQTSSHALSIFSNTHIQTKNSIKDIYFYSKVQHSVIPMIIRV